MPIVHRAIFSMMLFVGAGTAYAETYVFAHLLEQSGSQSQQPGTSESVLHFTLPMGESCAPVGAGAEIELWWYNADGTAAQSATGTDLCAPCTFIMDTAVPRLEVNLNDIIAAKGGYPTGGNGFDTYVVTGSTQFLPEPDDEVLVSLETKTWVDVMTLPSTSRMKIRPLQDRVLSGTTCRTFIFDHLVETAGTVGTAPNYDSQMFAAYTDTSPTATDVNLNVYLFDATTGAQLMDPVGGPICAPCTFAIGPGPTTQRKTTIRLDDLITNGGTNPFPASELHVLAVVNATGGDPNQVSMSSAVMTSRTGPSDLTVDLAAPDEVAALAPTAVEETVRRRLGLGNHPNPFNPGTTLSYSLPRRDRVFIRIVDSRGRIVRTFRHDNVPAGDHQLSWDGRDDAGRDLPSGIYIARLETSDATSRQKMALLR